MSLIGRPEPTAKGAASAPRSRAAAAPPAGADAALRRPNLQRMKKKKRNERVVFFLPADRVDRIGLNRTVARRPFSKMKSIAFHSESQKLKKKEKKKETAFRSTFSEKSRTSRGSFRWRDGNSAKLTPLVGRQHNGIRY